MYPLSLSRGDFDYQGKYNYLLSPAKYATKIKAFNKKFNYKNVALSDLTTTLNSDFYAKNSTNRVSSQKQTEEALALLEKGRKIMASAPNEYAIKYTDIITDMPIGTSGANIFDLEIPFVQMVLGGYVDMTCEPINISDNKVDLLKLMAYNTLPNYIFIHSKSSVLKDTDYSDYYSLCYDDWQKEAVELYNSYCKDMQKVRGKTITGWEMPLENIVKITYENGWVLMINSGKQAYDDGSVNIAGQSYKFYEEVLQ